MIHNRLAATKQDYELAGVEYAAILEAFDATDTQAVSRFQAAQERVERARAIYLRAAAE